MNQQNVRRIDLIWVAALLALVGVSIGLDDHDAQLIEQEAETRAQAKKAELLASLLASCLNGGVTLRVGEEPTVRCVKASKK